MKVDMVYWVDTTGGVTARVQTEVKPFGYRMAPIAQWKMLVSDEDIHVEKGKPEIIKVKPLKLPKNTMVGPLNVMRHAYGCVVEVVECGVPEKIEEEKCINQVLFIPIDSGEVKKGDLIGVLKVFFVTTGLLSKLFDLRPPKIELTEETIEANLTWRDNGNIYRNIFKIKEYGYTRSHIGIWELLIADESTKIKAGELTRIKIKKITLPPNTIIVPLFIMRNAYGAVLDVIQLGEPSRVEDGKTINEVVFLSVEDGEIKEGDLVGVINVYYVGVKELKPTTLEKEPIKINIVYRHGKGIVKRRVTVEPFGYKRRSYARWEVIVANERKKVRFGEPAVVRIKEIEIPKNTIVYPMYIMRHAYGAMIDLICDVPPWKVEEGGIVNKVLYLPVKDGEIKPGELLGVINLYETAEICSIGRVKKLLYTQAELMRKYMV